MKIAFSNDYAKSKVPVIVALRARLECLVLAYGKDTTRKIIIRTHNRVADEIEKAKCVLALRMLDMCSVR